MKKGFLNGALILASAGIVSKFIGFLFKVPLTLMIGSKGLGIYNYPYALYSIMLAISISGMPVTISKIVSEKIEMNQYYNAHKVFRVALFMMFCIGAMGSSFLFFASDKIISTFWPKEAYYPYMGLMLAPFFVSLLSVFRGYFQGMQLMIPTAVSLIFEAFARLLFGLGLAYLLLDYGIEYSAGGASFGATAGACIGLIVLIIIYMKSRNKIHNNIKYKDKRCTKEPIKHIIRNILVMSVPISIGAVAGLMMSLIDSLMINDRLLIAGIPVEESIILYGQLGVATTMINFPLTASMAISASIVPAISKAKVRNNYVHIHDLVEQGMKVGFYFGLPATMGLFILSQPILDLIFPTVNGGYEVLRLLSVALFFITLNQIFTGLLQGLGKITEPIKNLFIGSVLKICISYILLANPSYNIKGAVLGTIAGYFLCSLLNYMAIKKYTKFKLRIIDIIIKPLFAVTIMSMAVFYSFELLLTYINDNFSTLLSIIIGCFVYVVALVIVKGINIKEIKDFLKSR